MVKVEDFSFIRFERSGGFAGMTIVLDRESLSAELVEQIRNLTKETGLAALPDIRNEPAQRPDEFTYTLVFLAGEVVQTKVFPESGMPETLKPLIRFLSQMARHATRR